MTKEELEKLTLNELLNLYRLILVPEWSEITEEDKKEILIEAILENKDIVDTKIFEVKYMEKVIFDDK